MSWLEKVRQKSREEKIKLIWQLTAVVAVLLIILWILIGSYSNGSKKNNDLFNTVGNSFKNFKLENPIKN
jgi:hypothetical protein